MALTESTRPGEFLISEANGSLSREEVVFAAGAALPAGQVVGIVTASGKYAPYSNAANDGTEVAKGVLYASLAVAAGDREGVVIARHAEVIEAGLTGIDAAGKTDLAALQIIVR